jgi:hypothetical protein
VIIMERIFLFAPCVVYGAFRRCLSARSSRQKRRDLNNGVSVAILESIGAEA